MEFRRVQRRKRGLIPPVDGGSARFRAVSAIYKLVSELSIHGGIAGAKNRVARSRQPHHSTLARSPTATTAISAFYGSNV